MPQSMGPRVLEIPTFNLILSFLPVLWVLGVYVKWALDWKSLSYAILRMVLQLSLIGYFLTFLFSTKVPWITLTVLAGMLSVSAWIALYPIRQVRTQVLRLALLSMALGCLPVLALVILVVLPTPSWLEPSFVIPLAGMIFSNTMNTVSLAAERFESSLGSSVDLESAKREAYRAALIPMVNSFFAVGLVSLPGMMTGQILSGVDPLIAARYQIVVMTMVLGAGGTSASIYLLLAAKRVAALRDAV